MLNSYTIDEIKSIICSGIVLTDEPMNKHTTFKVGGNSKLFIIPANVYELSLLINYLYSHEIEYYIIGNGSNLLVSDKGYDGIIIYLGNNSDYFSDYFIEESDGYYMFQANSGCLMATIGHKAAEISASGFEALSGIPGCIGGAAIMNAGAYDSEMKDIVSSVEVIDKSGNILILNNLLCGFRYRGSKIFDNQYIVTSVSFKLSKSDPDIVKKANEKYKQMRQEKQPLEYPSAGSTFKRPEGFFAGKLISDCNLKGYTIGGAKVSEKHAGFIINTGSATAADIYNLINHVKDTVQKETGVVLEPEVRFLGEFGYE